MVTERLATSLDSAASEETRSMDAAMSWMVDAARMISAFCRSLPTLTCTALVREVWADSATASAVLSMRATRWRSASIA